LRRAELAIKTCAMSAPARPVSTSQVSFPDRVMRVVKPYTAPYYLMIAAVLGALTAGFVVVIVLLILVATNFNVLGLIE
jgi:hypothetical protein